MRGVKKTPRFVAPAWLHRRGGCKCFRHFTRASFDHRFNGHRTGDFSVRSPAHAIGNYEQIQRLHNAETIFIVGALLPDVALSTADNAHKSPFPDGRAKRVVTICTPGACWD